MTKKLNVSPSNKAKRNVLMAMYYMCKSRKKVTVTSLQKFFISKGITPTTDELHYILSYLLKIDQMIVVDKKAGCCRLTKDAKEIVETYLIPLQQAN